jgi:Chromosome segregation ATPases
MYKFMGTNCKRSFIERVAEKANIDPEGYHFVRQGKVTEIVEQSDTERREVIDELSGVKAFDGKKKKLRKNSAKYRKAKRTADTARREKRIPRKTEGRERSRPEVQRAGRKKKEDRGINPRST